MIQILTLILHKWCLNIYKKIFKTIFFKKHNFIIFFIPLMDKEPLSFSWSIPSQNPNIIVTQHKIARVVVFWPRIRYVKITLKTVVRERPDGEKNILIYLLLYSLKNILNVQSNYLCNRMTHQQTLNINC